jgi:aspartate dehydrogenase
MSATVRSAFLGPAETSREQLLAKLARDLRFPDWFGGTLDALFDLLTGDIEGPLRIVWRTLPATRAALGRDFEALRATLADAASERDDLELLIVDEQEDLGPPLSRPFRVGLAGLGAVGLAVARRLARGIAGLELACACARDPEAARSRLAAVGAADVRLVELELMALHADIVVEGLPPAAFAQVARPTIDLGRIFIPLSVGRLLDHADLLERARATGARILVPTGALLGLDAVRAAAEGEVREVRMVTRKPPAGLAGAPRVVELGVDLRDLRQPLKLFEGSAREGARAFPANVNVAAALALAGIGPERTHLEVWADPTLDRNTHTITVDADSARFTMTIENVPSAENPRTGRITAQSVVALLRRLVYPLVVGS